MPVQFKYLIAILLLLSSNGWGQDCELIKLCTRVRQDDTVYVRNVIDHYQEWDGPIQDINEYSLGRYLSKKQIAQFKKKATSIRNLSNRIDTDCGQNKFKLISHDQAQDLGKNFNESHDSNGFNDSLIRHYSMGLTQPIIIDDNAIMVVNMGLLGRLVSTTHLFLFKYDKETQVWVLQQRIQTGTS